MPSASSLWIVSAPLENADDQLDDLSSALGGPSSRLGALKPSSGTKLGEVATFTFPEFKTGTLSSLLTLSETLVKYDNTTLATVTKVVDTIKSLTSGSSAPGTSSSANRASPLASHLVTDDGRPFGEYLFSPETPWEWNRSKYRTEARSLVEVVDTIVKEVSSIDNAQRNKTAQYGVVKGQLSTAQRKKTGNLSTRSLAEVVEAKDFAGTTDSEYLETVLVAVPKNLVKEWESKYERLSAMVVPRSSTKLAADDEFTLFSATIFRRVKDDFSQKCREQKFVLRDFTYDAQEIEKGKQDLEALETEEKELWGDLLRLSRINFSEAYQALVHLKVVRAYIESVLRYGLPAAYFAAVIKPVPKQASNTIQALQHHFRALSPSSDKMKKRKGANDDEAPVGEFATVLEGEYYDFVLFEVESPAATGEGN